MRRIVTHSGSFQTDEVFAVATLQLLFGDLPVLRTREEAEMQNQEDFVVDVGGVYDPEKNRFDHHQREGVGVREGGVPYSSFGLVWKKYGDKLCGSREVSERIDSRLVRFIDAIDTGVDVVRSTGVAEPYFLHQVVGIFEPSWKEGGNTNPGFKQAVRFARNFLKREIKKTADILEGEEFVHQAYRQAEDKRVVVMDRPYPWADVLGGYREVLFAVYPSVDGNTWRLKAVREDGNSFINRKNLPQAWGGLRGEELAKVSGVKDALFCHGGLFTAAALSREGAIKLAQLALNS